MLLLVPPSADRARVVDLQLGGLEPAVGVWSGLGRAIMASDTFCFTKPKRKYGQQRALFSSFDGNLLLLPLLVVAGQVAPRGAAVAADVEPGRREGVAPRPRRAVGVPGR